MARNKSPKGVPVNSQGPLSQAVNLNNKQQYVSIGKLIKSHGVQGFVKVLPLTDFPERFEKLKKVFLFKETNLIMPLNIEQVRLNDVSLLVKFSEFNTPESVNNYREYLIKIPYEEVLELPENSFYIDDLKGLEAYSTGGTYLGKVIEVYSTANDIIEIVTPLKKEVMVPFVKEIVTAVDIKNKKIIINLIPGLFDEDFETT